MAVWSVVEFKGLESAERWDPEFYQPHFLGLDAWFAQTPHVPLGTIARIAFGSTPKGAFFPERGIPFVRSQDFLDGLVSSDLLACEPSFHREHIGSRTQPGDLLFAAIGATIGDIAIVPEWISEANINQNIARARVFDERYKPEFLWAYFLSSSGRMQLHRRPTGNAQPYLNTHQFRKLLVPLVGHQDRFARVVRELEGIVASSKTLYDDAEAELLARLGWDEIAAAPRELCYGTDFGELEKAGRSDPEFFHPHYARLRARIRERGGVALGQLATAFAKGTQPETYDEGGEIVVLKSKDVSGRGVDWERCDRTARGAWGDVSARLGVGDVVINATGRGTLGRAESITSLPRKAVAAVDLVICRLDENVVNSIYLALFLNSPAGSEQSEQSQTGSSGQLHLYQQHLAQFQVFVPRNRDGSVDLAWQESLADKVSEAGRAKVRAREKLEEAKRMVEDALGR